MDNGYFDLLYSQRVLPSTRKVLLQRLEKGPAYQPRAIRPHLYAILQAALRRLIPQNDRAEPIDIAASLDKQHFVGQGNGWRYAGMPADKEALELGLELLEQDARRRYAEAFVLLSPDRQDLLLSEVQSGDVRWSALESNRWFEEIVRDATSIFVSHPETLAEIGFSGIAIQPGWERVGLNEAEAWEPQAR
ncbi:MAG: gluconate 2-dehydrogenase subunit 3 family protein [Bryobacteraceae bacterium]